jgi:hypothetical protein
MRKFWFAIGICAVGLYVAAAPVWADWKSTKAAAAKYKVDMSDLQYTVKSTFLGTNIMDFPQGARRKELDTLRHDRSDTGLSGNYVWSGNHAGS